MPGNIAKIKKKEILDALVAILLDLISSESLFNTMYIGIFWNPGSVKLFNQGSFLSLSSNSIFNRFF